MSSLTLGPTSSISVFCQLHSSLSRLEPHTLAVGFVDHDVPVLEGVGNPTDETLGPLGRSVDGDKTKGPFRTGHFA